MRPRYAENWYGCTSLVRKDNFKFISVALLSEIEEEYKAMKESVLTKYHKKAVFDLTAEPWEYHNLIDTPKGQEVFKWAIEEHKNLKNM